MAEDKLKLHTTDKTLIEAARTGGEGLVEVTPELIKEITENLAERTADIAARYPALITACPAETRLAIVAWTMHHIIDHAREGGTFRYLIYDRLGFGPEAYVPLYDAGGMIISNEFELKD